MLQNRVEERAPSHIECISEMIKHIKYGSVTIIIQDSKIVQIEKTEKQRIKS